MTDKLGKSSKRALEPNERIAEVLFGLIRIPTYAEAPSGGPDWGLRFTVTFLFPK